MSLFLIRPRILLIPPWITDDLCNRSTHFQWKPSKNKDKTSFHLNTQTHWILSTDLSGFMDPKIKLPCWTLTRQKLLDSTETYTCCTLGSSFFLLLLNFGCAGSFLCGFSLVAVSRGYAPVAGNGLLVAVNSRIAENVLSSHRLNTCAAWASFALWHVGSSRPRGRSHVFCISRQILYHWATKEAWIPWDLKL